MLPPRPGLRCQVKRGVLIPLFLGRVAFYRRALITYSNLYATRFVFPRCKSKIRTMFAINCDAGRNDLNDDRILNIIRRRERINICRLTNASFSGLVYRFFEHATPSRVTRLLRVPQVTFRSITRLFYLLFTSFFIHPIRNVSSRKRPFLFLCLLRRRCLSRTMRKIEEVIRSIRRRVPLTSMGTVKSLLLLLPNETRFSLRAFMTK